MGQDPFAALVDLPGVADAADAARTAVDALLWDRAARARMTELVAASQVRGAWASAALDGADLPPEAVRDGSAYDHSPMGRVLAAALAVTQEVPRLVEVSRTAPMQAWARLHAVAARGVVTDERLGRPRGDDDADDPLHLSAAPPPAEVATRLEALANVLAHPTDAPAVVVAGVVHGELLALRPFAWGSGLVARAAIRLVLAARGLDPDCATVPEDGLQALGRPAYVRALRGYCTGTPDGVAGWLVHSARAVEAGALVTAGESPAPSS